MLDYVFSFELIEQESSNNEITKEKISSEQIHVWYKEEKAKLIDYLNSPLAKNRFEKDNLNIWKDWDKIRQDAIENINSTEFKIGKNENGYLWLYSYSVDSNGVRSITINDIVLSWDYKESTIRNAIYHELLHATLLYRVDSNIISNNLDLLNLELTIYKDLFEKKGKRAYFWWIKESYELRDLDIKKQKYTTELAEYEGYLLNLSNNWERLWTAYWLKKGEFSIEDVRTKVQESIYIINDLIHIIDDIFEQHEESKNDKLKFEEMIKWEAERESKYLSSHVKLYPRLKMIQNFLDYKYAGEISENTVTEFFNNVANLVQNDYKEAEGSNYFEWRFDEHDFEEFNAIFIKWLCVLDKKDWLINLLSLINILDKIVYNEKKPLNSPYGV